MRRCSARHTTQRPSTKALETNLMLAIREAELRMPDSGALEAARQLQDQSASDYSPYFAVLDTRPADPEFFVRGAAVLAKERYAERLSSSPSSRRTPPRAP